MAEVRVFAEGALRWIVASGTGTTVFATASAAQSALLGLVKAGTQQTSAQKVVVIYERGTPDHQKVIGRDAIVVTFDFLQAVTANDPALVLATGVGVGASIPRIHMEIKSNAKEIGATSAIYRQYLFGVCSDNPWTEGDEGNSTKQTWTFLSVIGPTASGYLG